MYQINVKYYFIIVVDGIVIEQLYWRWVYKHLNTHFARVLALCFGWKQANLLGFNRPNKLLGHQLKLAMSRYSREGHA